MKKNNNKTERKACRKKELRRYIQDKRDNLSLKEREKRSKEAAKKFISTKYYIKAKSILIYYPFRSEIDTTIIIKDALSKDKKIILPKVDNNELSLYFVNDISVQLKKGNYCIMEPVPSLCRCAKVTDIDLAVMPGVCFDKSLNRLGYGGGFYDKLLSYLPNRVKKISLCFDIQVLSKNIPTSKNDKKIDILITESTIYYSN